jgi:hypothetical protein
MASSTVSLTTSRICVAVSRVCLIEVMSLLTGPTRTDLILRKSKKLATWSLSVELSNYLPIDIIQLNMQLRQRRISPVPSIGEC